MLQPPSDVERSNQKQFQQSLTSLADAIESLRLEDQLTSGVRVPPAVKSPRAPVVNLTVTTPDTSLLIDYQPAPVPPTVDDATLPPIIDYNKTWVLAESPTSIIPPAVTSVLPPGSASGIVANSGGAPSRLIHQAPKANIVRGRAELTSLQLEVQAQPPTHAVDDPAATSIDLKRIDRRKLRKLQELQ